MSAAGLLQRVDALDGARVLVVGDLVLDEYLVGRPGRISREAPVLVLEFAERMTRPGSACNPAMNLSALGARPALLGIIGDDENGRALVVQLRAAGVDTGGVLTDTARDTATKTRILAEDPMGRRQQMVRLDRLPPAGPSASLVAALVAELDRQAPEADSVILSDYKGGVICAETLAAARASGRPVYVDSQGDLFRFRGCTLVKANLADAQVALGRALQDEATLGRAGSALLEQLAAQVVVITRGGEGLSVFESGRHTHIAGLPTEVFDATGAGDTVIAVLAGALSTGASAVEAAMLANYAASLVVRKLGNATVSPAELKAAIEQHPPDVM
jgi:rfaE bifunctional protein kinase chain/domain